MTAKARAKYAVAIILEAIQDNLRPALVDLIDNHCQGVEDAYVLYEGDTPEDGDISQPALDWWHGFYAAQDEALSGDVEKIVGKALLSKWVRSNDETSVLVDAILAEPVEDTARALAVCGVTQDDITALAGTEDAPASEPAKPPRRRAPSISEPTPVTEAAKRLLEALADHVKDQDVAEALEVSRSQAINYRRGTTLFAPDALQLKKLDTLVTEANRKLTGAIVSLKSAVELE